MDFAQAIVAFTEEGHISGLAESTVKLREGDVARFARWAEDRGLTDPADVTLMHLNSFRRHLFYYRKENGDPLSPKTQCKILVHLRAFFSYLAKARVIEANPATEIELPKTRKSLPRDVLNAEEAEAVLALPDVATTLGLRDKAILEMFYSTGIRRAECRKLRVSDVDFYRGVVAIYSGKGGYDRVTPVGDRALFWLRRYLDHSRPKLVAEPDAGVLFLTRTGQAFTDSSLTYLVHHHIEASGIGKSGACHIFRHTMATLMLDGGADLRYVQEMLGHKAITSTQIYTKVSVEKLKRVHAATHPGASVARSEIEPG